MTDEEYAEWTKPRPELRRGSLWAYRATDERQREFARQGSELVISTDLSRWFKPDDNTRDDL